MGSAALARQSERISRPVLFSAPMIRALIEGRKTQTRRILKPETLRVRVRHEVRSDFSEMMLGTGLTLEPGVYRAEMNQHGAVSARVGDRALGLRPGEFDFLCPYAEGHTYLRDVGGRKVWAIAPSGSQRLWVKETYALHRIHEATRPSAVLPTLLRDRWYRADGEQEDRLRGRWRPSIHMPRWASRITLEVTEVRVERLQDITPDDVLAEGITEEDVRCDGECGATPCSLLVPRFADLWRSINGAASWDANPWVWVVGFSLAEVKR